MFKIKGRELFEDDKHLATLKPNYLGDRMTGAPKSVFIIMYSEFRQTSSPHFLLEVRKFVRKEMNTSFAIVKWF